LTQKIPKAILAYMTTTTQPTHYTCSECGVRSIRVGSMAATMLRHMINAGEISVGEARAEMNSNLLPRDAVEELAGWVIHRADQGDEWRAGDPEVLPCGCRVAYNDIEQIELCEAHA
jgi:hypothetical protein